MKNELVIVIDFGGQYNQLVARRVKTDVEAVLHDRIKL